MSISTHTGSSESAPSYRSEVPSSTGSLADSVSTRTVSLLSLPPSYRSAPLPPLPASPLPSPSLVTAPDYAVHYRIYTPSGAVPVKAAASRLDPFVGRILARSVPPPHLAGMLKRRILAAEGLPDRTISVEGTPPPRRLSQIFSPPRSVSVLYNSYPSSPSPPSLYQSVTSTNGTQIYASMYDSEPMSDDVALVLTGDGRHGASSDNPLALVFLKELSVEERNARGKVEDFASREIPLNRYVYYRLYNQDGETRSSVAFDSVHTALGRIERAHITPPPTVDSLKSCIAKVEHKAIWKYADLYEGTAPCDPLGSSGSVGRHMGGDVNTPLLLVQPERTSGLFNRPARMLKTRKYRQSEKLTYDILQGTMILTDGVVKDSMCACLVPGRAERAMLKRKWFELLDE